MPTLVKDGVNGGDYPYGVLIRHGQHTDLEWLIEPRENK